MASSQPEKPSVARPKPRGINVRAFIETVESGYKPKPDFFHTETESEQKTPKVSPIPRNINTKGSTKPATSYKKTGVTNKSALKRPKVTRSPREPPPPPPFGVTQSLILGPRVNGEEELTSELNCPSEDSGNSTCDLKYGGSISSNQSSSHDPNYQTLSELDDGYSEHTGSSNHYASTTIHEIPLYSDPSSTSAPAKSSSNKVHHSAYKYHVPGKLTGTLPRDKKKAAFIGKAVAKGRTTLRKKQSSSEKAGDDTSSIMSSAKDTSSTLKSSTCLTDSAGRDSDFDFSDSEFDTDLSESEWETDGEHTSNKSNNNLAADPSPSSNSSATPQPKPQLQSETAGSDNSDYETPGVIEDTPRPADKPHSKSKSTFYVTTPENESKTLVSLMRECSTKKEKQAVFKKRLKNIKGNILDFRQKSAVQNFVKSSHTRIKTFIGGKFKKPSAAAPTTADYNGTEAPDNGSVLSTDGPDSAASDSQSVSSQNGHQRSPRERPDRYSLGASMSSASVLVPRQKSSITTEELRLRTQSLGALIVPPPLPPRNTVRSHDDSEAASFDSLPPPPPPPRTTSREQSMLNSAASVEACGSSSFLSNISTTESLASLSRLSPVSPSSEGGASSLLAPSSISVRRESSKLSVVSSKSLDESVKRRGEILGDSSIVRNSSLSEADKEKHSSGSRNVSGRRVLVPPANSSVETSTEDEEVRNKLIEDEPLYQEYHECMISAVRPKSLLRASTLLKGGLPSFTLWSTTPAVVSSGLLEKMNNEEIKLQEAMFEVVTSEASYLRSIKMLHNVFIKSAAFCNEEILSARDKRALFSNIPAVLDVSERLFKELETHWKDSIILTAVCEIISKYAYPDLEVYVKYCSNQSFQDRALKKLISECPAFLEALNVLEKSPECHGLSMSSFLLLPMQRITRLPLLLDAIQRRQEMYSDQYKHAERCYIRVKQIVSRCNEGARKMEQTEQILSIENKLSFNKLKKIALTSASRQLVKKGDLVYLCVDGGRSAANLLSIKPKNLSLFLFNDLLVITKKKDKGESFSVIDYASRVNVEVEEWSIGSVLDPRLTSMAQKSQAKFMFMLVLLENHQKKHSEYVLSCHTETERTRWIEAFTPQVQEDSDDKIYEAWDCPQVQITHDYSAQQPDELTVETGAIVNVLRKTADGWYECTTVSDGQTGWLPSSYTVELQNEHVRARHLKERYKLLQVVAKLTK